MGILNFFKQKKKTSESKKYNLENLSFLIEEEIKKTDDESRIFRNELKNLVDNFSLKIKQKIPGLKQFNLNNRRERQELKDIVMTNFNDYILYLENLIKDLEKIESVETRKYIKDTQFIFNNFDKNSKTFYERATILIGNELGEVREIINDFMKKFNEKLVLNKGIFEKMDLIKKIQDKLKELEEVKKIQKQIEDFINEIKVKILKIETEKKLTEKKYEEYKNSDEFKKFKEEQEEIIQENKIIQENILKIKREIDFKNLAKYFHSNPKKNNIIKRYYENFFHSLKEDSDLEIISLLKEANQKFNEDKLKILRGKILEEKNLIEDKEIQKFKNSLSNFENELKQNHNEIEKEKEKLSRFESKQKEISIQLDKIGLELGWIKEE